MRQCAKVYFQLKMEIQNGQKKVQQGTEGSNSTLSHLWGPLYISNKDFAQPGTIQFDFLDFKRFPWFPGNGGSCFHRFPLKQILKYCTRFF